MAITRDHKPLTNARLNWNDEDNFLSVNKSAEPELKKRKVLKNESSLEFLSF
jgi:hypothetical protein